MPRKSYADYDVPGEARAFEAQHFSGSFGAFLKASDELALDEYIADRSGSILDVGAGSGRLSIYMSEYWEADVVASDASIEMLRTAAARRGSASRPFLVLADAQDLPFGDNSFDYVVSFRTLMHLPDWRRAISEMCRVARCGVVIDAPARIAAPGAEAAYHRVVSALGGKASPYRTFTGRQLARTFAGAGFRVDKTDRRFVLPVKICRVAGGSRIPEKLEQFFRKTGIAGLLGGQYLLRAVPT